MSDINTYRSQIVSSCRKLVQSIYQLHDIDSINEVVVSQLQAELSARSVEIYRYEQSQLNLETSTGLLDDEEAVLNAYCNQSHPFEVVKKGKAIEINEEDSANSAYISAIYLPVKDTEKTMGVLGLTFKQKPLPDLIPVLEDIARALASTWLIQQECKENKKTDAQELLHTLKLYRLMVDYSPDLQMIIDIESFSIDEIGASCEHLLGYTTDELKDFPIMKILYPADIKSSMEIIKQSALEGLNIRNFSNRVISKNREVINLNWNAIEKGGKLFAAARKIEPQKENIKTLSDFDLVIRMESDGHIVDVFPGESPGGQSFSWLIDRSLYENVSMNDLDNLLNLHSLLLDGQSFLQEQLHLISPEKETCTLRALFQGFNLDNPTSGDAGIVCLAKIVE